MILGSPVARMRQSVAHPLSSGWQLEHLEVVSPEGEVESLLTREGPVVRVRSRLAADEFGQLYAA